MESLPEAERYTFFLNPYPEHHFAQCPRCGQNTLRRNRVLVVQLGPGLVMPAMVTCRYCAECELLIAHRGELAAALRQMLPPEEHEAVEGTITVIGTLDRGRLRGLDLESVTPAEAIEAFRPIRRLVHFDLSQDEAGNVEWVEVEQPYPELQMDIPVPSIEEVQALPQVDETWQLAALQLWTWITGEEGAPYRPYLILVVHSTGSFVILQELLRTEPSVDQVRDALLKAMRHPAMGAFDPHRPTTVVTDDEELVEELQPKLAMLNIRCVVGPTSELDEVLADLEYYLAGGEEPVPGLLDDPRVTPEQVGELFKAAAEFYREAPWRRMLDEDLVALRYPVRGGEWRYASVMGNAGMEFGVAVFEDLSDYDMLAYTPPEEAFGAMTYRSLTYDEVTAVPFADLDAIEYYGWEVAADDAYPIPLTFTEDEELERPGPEEIEWYTVALRALVTFFRNYWPAEAGYVPESVSTTLSVPLAGRRVEVELRYPAELAEMEEEQQTMESQVYRFKVQLRYRKRRWHRIEILGSQTLADLDAIIREAFKHDPFDHLAGFWLAGGRRGPDIDLATVEPFGGGENADLPIAAIGLEQGDRLKYVYDFGDWVEHIITLEAVTEPEADIEYPRITR